MTLLALSAGRYNLTSEADACLLNKLLRRGRGLAHLDLQWKLLCIASSAPRRNMADEML